MTSLIRCGLRCALAVGVALAVALPGPASADRWRGGPSVHGSVGIGFGARYPYAWHGGVWHHGWRDGRTGWWWVVDGSWYPYAEPVYPYPPYPYGYQPYVYPPAYPYPTYAPPPIVAPTPAPAQTWYACDDPQGYYPYVNQCNVPWRQVPVTPTPR